MKNIKIYIIILLFFGFFSAMGQAAQPASQVRVKAEIQQEDPKLSQEEKALLLNAGLDNPSRIDESYLLDHKITEEERATEDDYGDNNAIPSPESLTDPKLDSETQLERESPSATENMIPVQKPDQAEGEVAGATIDYRLIKGDGSQPAADKPAKSDNYKEMQGPGEQPPGDKPGK